jgi:CDP-diacylglycerol---serine O-phosphatidyltransferase
LNLIKHIPNLITLGNLLCGSLAIMNIFYGDLIQAAYLVLLAAVLDFFDGFAARMLKAYSDIGKDLDSLADMVSFGVVPGFMMFKMISHLTGTYYGNGVMEALRGGASAWYPLAGFVIILFSALRLARFNNDTRQVDGFIGLPTPANALLICSLPLVWDFGQSYQTVTVANAPFITDGANLAIAACMLSLLLVTEIRLFSLKFRSFGWKENQARYLFLVAALVLMVVFKFKAIPLLILLYIGAGLVKNIFSKTET